MDYGSVTDKIFQSVNGGSTAQKDYTVTTGTKLQINYFQGSGATQKDVKIELIYDPTGDNTIIYATHDSIPPVPIVEEFAAGKIIRIKLTNSSAQAESFGGKWFGDEFTV